MSARFRLGLLVVVAFLAGLLTYWLLIRAADRPVNPIADGPLAPLPDTSLETAPIDTLAPPPDTLAPPDPFPPSDTPAPVPAPDTLRRPETRGGVDPLDLIIPVAGIEADELIDTFNEARSQGRVHNAIDIIAPQGTPVLAAADGKIVRLFTSEKGGLTIYQLAPDNRTVYYYAHLDAYDTGLKAGKRVRQGEIIAYVGDTGNAVPGNYHLHFAIWQTDDPKSFWDGDAVNPFPLLRGARP